MIKKIKIEMLSKRRIEPTPTGVEAGKKNRISYMQRELPPNLVATEPSRYM